MYSVGTIHVMLVCFMCVAANMMQGSSLCMCVYHLANKILKAEVVKEVMGWLG